MIPDARKGKGRLRRNRPPAPRLTKKLCGGVDQPSVGLAGKEPLDYGVCLRRGPPDPAPDCMAFQGAASAETRTL